MKTKIFVLELLCLFFWLTASAQRVASVTGNWGSTATWGGAAVPTASDHVIINSGITVTVNGNATALSITNNGTLNVGAFSLTISNETIIAGTGTINITSATGTKTFNGDVTINSGGKWNNTVATVPLTFPGNFTNDGTFNSGAGVYTFSGTGKSIGGSVATTFANLSITGSVTNNISQANGGLTISTSLSGSGTLTNATNSLLVINGTVSITGLVANANPNTVTYNISSGPAQSLSPANFHHLVLNGSGSMNITDPITINGNTTINGPKVTWNGNGSLIINGDLLINSEFIVDRSGLTVEGVTTIAGTLNIKQAFFSTINDMVVSPGGDVKINTQQTTLTITGNINGSWNGGMKGNTFNLTGAGKTIIGTIDFGPLSTTNITGSYTNNGTLTFNTLNINSDGTMINNSSATVMGNLESPVGPGSLTQATGSLLKLNGTSTVTVLDASASNNTVTYIGTTQTIRSTTYHHLVLDASGTKTAGGSLTVNGDFVMNNGSASVFAYGPYVHDFYGNWIINSSSTNPINATAGSTINFKGANPVTIGGSTGATLPFTQANFSNTGGVTANENMSITTGIMTVLSNAILTLPATTVISGTGTFDLNAGGNLEIGSTDGIAASGATGNVQTTNRVFNTAANYTYNGPSSQMTGTGLGSGIPATPPLLKTVNKLSINNISGITLSNDINVAGSLEFMNGKVTTNANKVIIESSASISGAGPEKYIYGNLRRNIPASADLVIPFDIGDAINYSPATINFTGTPSGGSIDAFVSTPAPPASGSGILSTKYINRSWTLLNNAVGGFTSYNPTFTFAPEDLIGGVNTADVIIAKNSGGTWSKPTIGTRGSTSTQATGLTSFSEFIIGEPADATQYKVSSSNNSPLAGSEVTITAQLADVNGNAIQTPGVIVTWSKSDSNGSFTTNTSITDANGVATVVFTSHTVASTATTITATDASNLTGTSGVITTISGAAAKYIVSASNYSPAAGSAVTISAQLADVNNNPVTTAGVVLTWSKSDINGTFASATSTTDANGLATVMFTTHTEAGAATTVTATDAGNLTGTSGVITTISGAAAKYIVSASNYSPAAGSAVTISAQLADANNNPVTTAGVAITWSKSDLNGAFASATSTTDANGLATVMFTTHTVAGSATTVTATDAGNLTGTSGVITTISGAASKYLVSASNYSPAAGSAVTISAQLADVNNNPVTTAGVVLTWSKSDINGTFASATSTTDANGLATVMFTTHTEAGAATTVTATDPGNLTGTSGVITTISGAAAKYLVSASDYSPAAGSAVTISAQLADANNNPVTTAGVVLTWSKSDINGTFASATSTTDANGLASVMFTTHTVAGAATTVTATDAGSLTGTTPSITTISGAASKYLISASNYSPAAGSSVTISAQLADVNNNPVTTAGVVLTWSKSDINGTFASATSTTDANGLASVMFTTHTVAGTATTVTATDPGSLTGTTPSITTISGAASKYLISASNYSPAAGSSVTISAQLADVNNNPVTTAGVVLTWSKSDINGTFASATSTTDANGLASVIFTTHTVAATATTVTATDPGSLTGITPAITTISGAAAKYIVSASNYSPAAGSAVTISAQLADANNNPVTTAGVAITWSKSDLNGAFASATSTTDANGLATVMFTTHTVAGTATTITATDAGSLTGTTPSITTISGAASKYLVSASNYSPAAGSSVSISAQLADVNNNPVTTAGVVLTWSKSDINGAFASATSTTDANGLASVMFTTHTVAGAATTITATDPGSLTGITPAITTISGAAAKYIVSASNYSPAAGSAVTISAQLADVNNNPVTTTGIVLTWSKSDINGAFASATSTTDANGLATVMFTTHTVAGTATTITATDAGSLTGTTPSITTVSGTAAKYIVSASNYSPAAGSAVTISAQLADVNNNPVATAGVVLTWSKSDINGTFASATNTTDANGLASVMFTTHTVAGTATTITATDAGSLTGTTPSITTISGAASKYLISASNYSPAAGSAVTISAQLADVNNNPVTTAGVVLTWSKSDINGTFASATSTTDANGLASVMFTTHTVAATATTVTATCTGNLTGTSPTITTISGTAAKYIVSASNYSPAAGSAVTITAQMVDENNNPVSCADMIVNWSKSDINGSFASTNSTTDANGLATVMFTTHTAAAITTSITATCTGNLTGTSPTITTISGAAAKYVVSASDYSPAAGSGVTISAQLADANNNPVTTAGVVLTWSKSDINGAFASATSTTDANGLASVMFTTHTVAGTATTITATDAGSLTGTTPSITTVSGIAVKLVITGSGNQMAGDSQDLSISALDANNNKVLTYSGDKSLIFGGAGSSGNPIISPTVKDKTGAVIPFGSSTIITFVGGSATVVSEKNGVMTLYKAELATISVTDQNISANGDDRLNVNVSAAGFNKLVVSLTSIQTSSIPFTGTNTLIAQDVYGNTVSTFKSSENNIQVTTSLEGVISGLSGTNILNNHSDFNAGVANLTTLGLTFSGLPGTGTFTFTPSSGVPATSGDVTINAGNRQATPTFSPVAGAIAFGTTVTISSPGADAIYYTTDGSNPTTSSINQALTPLIINSAVTVKALAVRSGSDNSDIGIASYTQAISADLISLALSGNPSNYTFTGNNYIYTEVKTTYDVASIIITPTGIGTITVNGVIITSGNSSAPINLIPGIDHIITVTVTEIGKSPKTYTIHVKRALSSAKSITAFDFTSPAIQGVVNEASKIITINVPFGTSLTGLVPIISHTGASVSPTSGEAHNFIAGVPAIYTVTAADASTQNYSVSITYINEPPTDIVLSATTLFENQESGTLAGTLNSLSNNINNFFTYSLISGSGDTDNDKFIITNKEIRTSQLFDYEKQKTYSVRIRSTTQQGSSLDKSFIIQISDINEAPSIDELANQSICYTTNKQVISLSGISAGPETGQSTTISVSSNNPGLFRNLTANGNQISYTIAPDQSGTATLIVRVKDNGGTNNGGVDEITRSCTITVNPLIQVDIISNKGTTIARGEIAHLTASGGSTYQWSNSSGIITGQNSASLQVRPMQTTSYTVLVTNASGCTSTQTAIIEVKEDFTKILPANNFSPNGDQINDTWKVENIDAYPDHNLIILDRGGRTVYTARNYKNDWDGTVNGSRLDEGTYYYLFEFNKPGITPIKGFISIVY